MQDDIELMIEMINFMVFRFINPLIYQFDLDR